MSYATAHFGYLVLGLVIVMGEYRLSVNFWSTCPRIVHRLDNAFETWSSMTDLYGFSSVRMVLLNSPDRRRWYSRSCNNVTNNTCFATHKGCRGWEEELLSLREVRMTGIGSMVLYILVGPIQISIVNSCFLLYQSSLNFLYPRSWVFHDPRGGTKRVFVQEPTRYYR